MNLLFDPWVKFLLWFWSSPSSSCWLLSHMLINNKLTWHWWWWWRNLGRNCCFIQLCVKKWSLLIISTIIRLRCIFSHQSLQSNNVKHNFKCRELLHSKYISIIAQVCRLALIFVWLHVEVFWSSLNSDFCNKKNGIPNY